MVKQKADTPIALGIVNSCLMSSWECHLGSHDMATFLGTAQGKKMLQVLFLICAPSSQPCTFVSPSLASVIWAAVAQKD